MIDKNRRKLMGLAGASAIIPLSALVKSGAAQAADMPLVDPASAQAVSLKYIAVSATDGQMCSNCALYQGAADAESGVCPLFQGSAVGSAAWCSAWVAKS